MPLGADLAHMLAETSKVLYHYIYEGAFVAQWLRTLDLGPRGREFDSRPVRYQVTTLGMLFTPIRACVGARGLVVGVDS